MLCNGPSLLFLIVRSNWCSLSLKSTVSNPSTGPMFNFKSLILIFLLSIQLSGCGFALRGSDAEGLALGEIFVDAAADVPIAALLREKIADQGLIVADNRERANVLVRLTRENQGQRVLSVQSEGKVSEFELRHVVDMVVVKAPDGEFARYSPGLQSNRVSVRREYTFDDTGVLGKEDEASILQREMRDELARTLLVRIIASG